LEGYLQEIRDEISEERFENIRLSIIQTMESSATNIKSMTELLNMLAFKYDADFSWVDQRVEALKTLTYEEFLTIASEMIGRTNRQRFALLMQGTNTNEQLLHYKQLPSLQRLRAISTY
jgi:insulysin